jgi:hypothetical protein
MFFVVPGDSWWRCQLVKMGGGLGGASGGGQRKIWSLFESPRVLQRDFVYSWLTNKHPCIWAQMQGEEESCGVSANEHSCTQVDLTPYLTYRVSSAIVIIQIQIYHTLSNSWNIDPSHLDPVVMWTGKEYASERTEHFLMTFAE